ncbi:CPCC family cysteine-rich protein [Sanguibacter sp. 25GB23B1]
MHRFWRRRRTEVGQPAVVRGPGDDPSLSDEELLDRRRLWFERYLAQRNVFAPTAGGPYTCPCCGHSTLGERGGYEICDECGWEDDGQDDHDAHVVRGGPNGRQSLEEAREDYVNRVGARLPHRPPVDPV